MPFGSSTKISEMVFVNHTGAGVSVGTLRAFMIVSIASRSDASDPSAGAGIGHAQVERRPGHALPFVQFAHLRAVVLGNGTDIYGAGSWAGRRQDRTWRCRA